MYESERKMKIFKKLSHSFKTYKYRKALKTLAKYRKQINGGVGFFTI